MIILKKKQVDNFIEAEKEQDIHYTEDDVNFYNQHLDDDYIYSMKNNKYSFYTALVCVLLLFIDALLNVNLTQYLMLCLFIPVFVINFKVKEKIEQFKALDNINFNYFLQQKIIKKLLKRNELVDMKILNKIIKLYPKKEKLSIFFKNNNIKTIDIIYDQYLNMLEYNKENP